MKQFICKKKTTALLEKVFNCYQCCIYWANSNYFIWWRLLYPIFLINRKFSRLRYTEVKIFLPWPLTFLFWSNSFKGKKQCLRKNTSPPFCSNSKDVGLWRQWEGWNFNWGVFYFLSWGKGFRWYIMGT